MANPLVKFDRVAVGFSSGSLVSDVSFELHHGQALALIGPNGSGKSTLIRAAFGELAPLQGEIQLVGRPVRDWPPEQRARQVALVPQQEHLAFEFTAREVVAMGRICHSSAVLESDEDRRAINEALEKFECAEFSDRSMQTLSGGERQRVLFARAEAQQAQLVILDEPNAHLDLRHQLELIAATNQMVKSGKGVWVVLHDLQMVSQLRCPVLLLQGGRAHHGSLWELHQRGVLNQAFQVEFAPLSEEGPWTPDRTLAV